MTLIVLILCILTMFAATDIFTSGHKRLHNQIYEIAFFITFFLFTIKYYYGADVLLYDGIYNSVPTLSELLHGERLPHDYEVGFEFFVSIIKSLHISFWWMTVIISVIYFAVIHKLFKKIPTHRTLALCLLVALEFNLIFATFRQCLAVSCFILMYFAYTEGKTGKMLLYCILTATLHKSGIFFGIGGYILLNIKDMKIKSINYICLLALMMLIIILPFDKIMMLLTNSGNNTGLIGSISYHLSFIQRIQPILPLYVLFFIGLYAMNNKTKFIGDTKVILFCGMVCVALFYLYYPMIWRLRSYFIPFLIVYLFSSLPSNASEENVTKHRFLKSNNQLICQLSYIFVFLFCCYTIISCYRNQNLHKSRIYETCTIFDLKREKYKGELREKQLSKANYYWKNESLIKRER